MTYLPALYRPADRGRTWRDAAPDIAPSPTVPFQSMQFQAPTRSAVMAPVSCVTTQDTVGGTVALVGKDRSGRVMFRVECPNDATMVRWWTKAIRLALAMFCNVVEVELKLVGS